MRAITKLAEQGDNDAALARDVESCRKYIGAYAVKLKGRVDAIVFCGGIGSARRGLPSKNLCRSGGVAGV